MSLRQMIDNKEEAIFLAQGLNRFRRGLVWIPRTGFQKLPLKMKVGIVKLYSPSKQFLGEAIYDEKSPHTVRCLGTGLMAASLEIDFFYERLLQAMKMRKSLLTGKIDFDNGAYRWVHGEADALSGLIIDVYAQRVVLQVYNRFMEECLSDIIAAIKKIIPCSQIILRNDGSGRQLDGLERFSKVLEGSVDTVVSFNMARMTWTADLLKDRKTGFFLDQQLNYHRVSLIKQSLDTSFQARAIDFFSYHGGFALALAQAGFAVQAGDIDSLAVERAKHNAKTNQLTVQFETWDAFEKLRRLEAEKAQYDLVVLDPPALAKRPPLVQHSAAWIKTAYRAYKEINLRAMRLLRPGGLLLTFSCSAGMTLDLFDQMLFDAALDAKRMVVRLERLGPSLDHPCYLAQTETDYLKGALLRIVEKVS